MTQSQAVFCTLTVAEQRARRAAVRDTIVPQIVSVINVPQGIRLEFQPSGNLLELLSEFVELEKDCCQFLTFNLTEESEKLFVHIEGPVQATEVLALFGETIKGEQP